MRPTLLDKQTPNSPRFAMHFHTITRLVQPAEAAACLRVEFSDEVDKAKPEETSLWTGGE